MSEMKDVTRKLLEAVADFRDGFTGAYHIRENGRCAGVRSSEHIRIQPKTDKSGLDVTVLPGTRGETVSVPACVTETGTDDIAYNDFVIGDHADVVIVAGCGIHAGGRSETRHSGIHCFIVGEGARVRYVEKHIGTGEEDGNRVIDPVSNIVLGKNSRFEMDTTQISGVRRSARSTTVSVAEGARLIVRERLLTERDQEAESVFRVTLNGDGSGADIVSRSVAKDRSRQKFESTIIGNAPCSGHSECDSIIDDEAVVDASPRLFARHKDASMIHEAAIGKIAGEQILKFRTLGLTEEEAKARIIEGFLE